jgi:hypothetical protein
MPSSYEEARPQKAAYENCRPEACGRLRSGPFAAKSARTARPCAGRASVGVRAVTVRRTRLRCAIPISHCRERRRADGCGGSRPSGGRRASPRRRLGAGETASRGIVGCRRGPGRTP